MKRKALIKSVLHTIPTQAAYYDLFIKIFLDKQPGHLWFSTATLWFLLADEPLTMERDERLRQWQ